MSRWLSPCLRTYPSDAAGKANQKPVEPVAGEVNQVPVNPCCALATLTALKATTAVNIHFFIGASVGLRIILDLIRVDHDRRAVAIGTLLHRVATLNMDSPA